MKIILLLSTLFSISAHAWTLNNNFAATFKNHKVKIRVDENTICDQAFPEGTIYDFQDLIKPAVNNFWNRVPTSSLSLKASGFSVATSNMNTGILCSPTDDPCVTSAQGAGTLIGAVKDIVIACNNNNANFGSPNVLAVTIPNNFSGQKITGAVILVNNMSGTVFAGLSRADKIAVLAHEIGHAIGLGHSEATESLMYFRTVNQRTSLGQDDMDGVSFLYPMQVDGFGLLEGGLLGGCGTITTEKKSPPGDPPFSQMMVTLGVLIVLIELRKLFLCSKARSAARTL